MRIFCDTNVLIAAFSENHPHYDAARRLIERVLSGQDEGFVAAHSLAEVYSVLTRLPGEGRVAPTIAWKLISTNILKNFTVVHLTGAEYAEKLQALADSGARGGVTYDALLLAAAEKCGAEKIYTLNVRHFRDLASPRINSRIVSPDPSSAR